MFDQSIKTNEYGEVQVNVGLYPHEVEQIATALSTIAREHLERVTPALESGQDPYVVNKIEAVAHLHAFAASWRALADVATKQEQDNNDNEEE